MSRAPLYERVESVLAGDIADGSLAPETQLPSEDGLVERFKVSRTTVRKAIQNLVERGLVEVRRGKGTFVTQPKITQELTELTGFVEDMQAMGRTATARLLDKRIVAADEAVAHQLALAPGTLVVRLRRVRLADRVAMSFDETYLPRDLGEKVAENDLEAEPVFALLEGKYGTPLVEAEYKLEATAADPVTAEALQVPAGSPIFLIERTSYTSCGACRRSPAVLLLPPRRCSSISCRLGQGEGREGAPGAGDRCGTTRRAAGSRPQTGPCLLRSCCRAAGRRRDCRGRRGLHHCVRPRVPLERKRLPSSATNSSRRRAADPTVDVARDPRRLSACVTPRY